MATVSRAQKISTVVDLSCCRTPRAFHALKKFLLLQIALNLCSRESFTRSKNFYCCRFWFAKFRSAGFTRSKNFYCCRQCSMSLAMACFTRSKNFYCCRYLNFSASFQRFTRSKNFYCCRSRALLYQVVVSRAQKISTVVDKSSGHIKQKVSRAQKISTVVDMSASGTYRRVSRAQKISTVVDAAARRDSTSVSRAQKISTVVDWLRTLMVCRFHALKKFLLLQMKVLASAIRLFHALKKFLLLQILIIYSYVVVSFTRSKNFYCCRSYLARSSKLVSRAQKISTVVD